MVGKNCRRKSFRARGETKELLRRNPKNKHEQGNADNEEPLTRRAHFVIAPEKDKEPAADDRLQRVNPVLWRRDPERTADSFQQTNECKETDESRHRQNESHQLAS